ncbi:MAG: response regulator [Rhodospirillaceae bacterium]|jgi:CheY-like chemotaxis protein|nr:response regulator [Rhodospirillaceae bacterium]MBT4688123.1 response regulator [Rhodospirillaceae bacterium]MBT5080290.1 response regulator [Rhodospirillaceae bacterium]MBT5525011.1 response regulator [Rhodospirillaceae bacterium]MBT5881034.1 response regulator [Rhodospirillaceae bacterium]
MVEDPPSKRLLVVDDEPAFCRFVHDVSQDLGFAVETTTTGQEFMTTYTLFLPETIVMDIVMPEIEGVELTQWLIQEGFTGKLILVTGYAPNYVAVAQRVADASAQFNTITLLKPIGIDDLEAALQAT